MVVRGKLGFLSRKRKERDGKEQDGIDVEEVFQQAQLKSWLWMKHKAHRFNYSFTDWILNPMLCIKSYK